MNVNAMFPSTYLKAADLQGRNVTVMIDRVEMEVLGQGENAEHKPIIYFQGKEKGLVANKTNLRAIAAVYGEETDDWHGAEIVLFEAMVDFQGKVGPAIRVKIPPRKPAGSTIKPMTRLPQVSETSPPPLDIDDEVPF